MKRLGLALGLGILSMTALVACDDDDTTPDAAIVTTPDAKIDAPFTVDAPFTIDASTTFGIDAGADAGSDAGT